MGMGILTGQKACPAGTAEGGRYEGILTEGPLICDPVKIGRLEKGVPHRAHMIPAVIVT